MKRVKVDYASCILTSNSLGACRRCEEICPDEVIKIGEGGLKYTPSLCIECAACLGVCPTGSFAFESFSMEGFCSEFALEEESLISCAKNLPCLAALSAEHLIGLAIEKEAEIIMDTGHCGSCRIAETVFWHIENSIKEANSFLAWFGLIYRVVSSDVSYSAQEKESVAKLSRRELFSRLNIKDIVKTKAEFDKRVNEDDKKPIGIGDVKFDRESVRSKKMPFKRELFISSTRKLKGLAGEQEIEAESLSFLTDKRIKKEECTNCALCYQVCPTGALSGDMAKGRIEFDFLYCVSCGSCHDICPKGCIEKETVFKQEMFTEPKRKRLATFFMKSCPECGALYVNNGAQVCARCQELDDEARELTGMKA